MFLTKTNKREITNFKCHALKKQKLITLPVKNLQLRKKLIIIRISSMKKIVKQMWLDLIN